MCLWPLMQAMERASESLTSIRAVQAHTAERSELRGYVDRLLEQIRIAKTGAMATALIRHTESIILMVNDVIIMAVRWWGGGAHARS